jgi:hypothetical protein
MEVATMTTGDTLYLHESILLLALRDEKGTLYGKLYLPAMGGAILAELLMDAWILVDDTKKQHVTVVRCGHPGEPVLDRAVDKIRERKRKTSLKNWVTHLGNLSKLRHEVAAGLCRRGILREDEGRVLALFRRKLYPQIDPRPERQLIERLRRAIFTETSKVEPRTGVLIALAQATDLLSIPFEKKELKKRKKRIESIVNGELLGRATKEAVQAAAAAAMVAVIIPTTIVATR